MGFWESGILGKWDFGNEGFWEVGIGKVEFWESGKMGLKVGFGEIGILGN